MRKTFVLAVLMLTLSTLTTLMPVAKAVERYEVKCLVAWDEEWSSVAQSSYGYSAQDLARVIFWTSAGCLFDLQFDIKFTIGSYVSWDSYDDPETSLEMLEEVVRETGFVSGAKHGGVTCHVLVAFTDQDIPNAYGRANSSIGAVIVQEFYTWSGGQHTDNILQHELSHLYKAKHHDVEGMDCVMNTARYSLGFPDYIVVPHAVMTNNWCSQCINKIEGNREIWGGPYSIMGSGGGWNQPDGDENG